MDFRGLRISKNSLPKSVSALEARIHELLAGISEADSSQMCIYSPDLSPEWHTLGSLLSWMADRLLPVPSPPSHSISCLALSCTLLGGLLHIRPQVTSLKCKADQVSPLPETFLWLLSLESNLSSSSWLSRLHILTAHPPPCLPLAP